ncbi:MAG: response regulator [Fibrobacteria bacterium]|nr:response regulator [Fibrobacteria bacterium]
MADGNALQPRIVLVDDEEMVLSSISSFLELETNYIVDTFTSGFQALEHIKNNEVNLIMSDYLMPEMDGLAFLADARKIKPEATRIILTGYADKENAIKAINEIGLFQYIEKPWNNDDLFLIIRNGIEKNILAQKLKSKMEEISKAHLEFQELQTNIMKTLI